jgi:hypothetical protein
MINATRLRNGAYQVSAMVIDPFVGARLETQVYYGYTKAESMRQYKAHLVSKVYRLV